MSASSHTVFFRSSWNRSKSARNARARRRLGVTTVTPAAWPSASRAKSSCLERTAAGGIRPQCMTKLPGRLLLVHLLHLVHLAHLVLGHVVLLHMVLLGHVLLLLHLVHLAHLVLRLGRQRDHRERGGKEGGELLGHGLPFTCG